MALVELTFPSRNERDTIQAWIYTPARPARAVVQIVHGLGEHSRRYLRLISALLDQGFAVAADDHAGHGRTAAQSGVWQDAGPDAAAVVVADEQTLRAKVRQLYPDLPYVMFGHSWGSMIARQVAAESSEEFDGLILGGIAAQIRGIDAVLDREALAAEGDPEADASGYLGDVFAGFVERYEEGAFPTAWVARDEGVVRDHAADPLNNFGAPMTVRFMQGFVGLYDAANGAGFYSSLRPDLPIMILAGGDDPVANYGEGAFHVANRLVLSGHRDVATHVYSGYRHEVHNEPEIRDDVAGKIIDFVNRVAG